MGITLARQRLNLRHEYDIENLEYVRTMDDRRFKRWLQRAKARARAEAKLRPRSEKEIRMVADEVEQACSRHRGNPWD